MAMLKARVNAPVIAAEDAGWNGDAHGGRGFRLSGDALEKRFAAVFADDDRRAQPMTGGKHRKPNSCHGPRMRAIQVNLLDF